MMDSARRTGPALEAHYQFLTWLIPAVERFPRSQKFLLGDRIQTTALDVLESLIDAIYTKARSDHLAHASGVHTSWRGDTDRAFVRSF